MICVLSVVGELFSDVYLVVNRVTVAIEGMEGVNNILIILCYTILHREDKHKDAKISVNHFFLFFFSSFFLLFNLSLGGGESLFSL